MSKHKTSDEKLRISQTVRPKVKKSKKDTKRPVITTSELIKGTNANNQFR